MAISEAEVNAIVQVSGGLYDLDRHLEDSQIDNESLLEAMAATLRAIGKMRDAGMYARAERVRDAIEPARIAITGRKEGGDWDEFRTAVENSLDESYEALCAEVDKE